MRKILFIYLNSFLSLGIYAQTTPRYLTDSIFSADPSAHVFNGRIYIYASHDIETGVKDATNGNHYNMRDYHVFSMDTLLGKVNDHGVSLQLENIAWAGRQLWAPDCVYKNGRYYLYFPARDKNDIFKIGVAVSNTPEGPFVPEKNPLMGSYSIDPAVFKDSDEKFYMLLGGISGGQLQRYRENKMLDCSTEPGAGEAALCPKIARMSDSMLEFSEELRDVQILDENGEPLKASDTERRFFEGAWMHTYKGVYYLSYSTGSTHKICYATGSSPYGPFIYRGTILTPVTGWTTHHSIITFNNHWYLFYHDSKQSKGVSYLRSIKLRELAYNPDGTIKQMNGQD